MDILALFQGSFPPLSLDRPGLAIEGPSAAYLRGQEGSMVELFYKPRILIGWTQFHFILSPPKKVLYQFRTELVCAGMNDCTCM